MPGELVPLVLLPRYTSYVGRPGAGTDFFSTIAMDVTEYSSAIVNVWRGKLVGATSPEIKFWFQESTDQVEWTDCAGVTAGVDPGENAETQYTATLAKRWFRVKVRLGVDTMVSCWIVGFLEKRIS